MLPMANLSAFSIKTPAAHAIAVKASKIIQQGANSVACDALSILMMEISEKLANIAPGSLRK